MGRNIVWEPKEKAARKFEQDRKHEVCATCDEKIDQFGCGCFFDDSDMIRRAERRNEQVLHFGYQSEYSSLTEY